jgi:sulfur relay protein TusB/DsrH
MKLAVFVSDYRITVDTLDKLKAEKLGIILVGNGVYHASVKEGGNASPLLKTSADFYALTEDLETRGIKTSDIDSSIKSVNYGDVVDLIFNDYEKTAWL